MIGMLAADGIYLSVPALLVIIIVLLVLFFRR